MSAKSLKSSKSNGISDIFSVLVYTHPRTQNKYYLRVIEVEGKDKVKQRKFGFSEFWFCKEKGTYVPSSTHHVFLPLEHWSLVAGYGSAIERCALKVDDENGRSEADDATGQHSAKRESAVAGQYGPDGDSDERDTAAVTPTDTEEGNGAPSSKKRREEATTMCTACTAREHATSNSAV